MRNHWIVFALALLLSGCGGGGGGESDTTAPTVTSTVPASAATGVPPNAALTAIFSEPMDAATIDAGGFNLSNGVTGAVTYDAESRTATFTPSSQLAYSTNYTATVTTGAKDLAGNALAANHVWTFTTGAALDTTPPTVEISAPAPNATDVAVNAPITATFSEAMNAATINIGSFNLSNGVTGAVAYDAESRTATLTPSSQLAYSTNYTTTVTTGAKDLAGNALAANHVWTFTTGAALDTTPPTVEISVPAPNATDVAVDAPITATFSEAMNAATINTGSFNLSDGVTGTVAYDAESRTATFTPSSPLAHSTTYTATVTTGARDLAGVSPAANHVWTFTTRPQSGGNGAPAINVTSHSDGQVITGSRTITLQWTATDDAGIASVALTLNGAAQPVTGSAGNYSATLTLADRANTVVIQASDAAPQTTTLTLNLTYPFLAFTNGQAASVVIGQVNFVSGATNQGGAAGANTINWPYGNAAVNDGILYLPDYSNNRILGFNAVPTVNDAYADFVLGQPDFASVDFATSSDGLVADRLDGPQTVVIAEGKMFVADLNNHRVLIWNSVPTASGVPADVVVGQPDVTSRSAACTNVGLNGPESIHVVNGKLIVGDSGNNRLLIWNTIPTTHGQPASLVLGQTSSTSCVRNRGGAVAADTLYYPSGVWSDGVRLIVADPTNNRVLLWNSFPTVDGQAADVVLGQADMTTSSALAASERDLRYPGFVFSNGNQLFVADGSNNRVLIWDAMPTTDYQPADRVLGQADFVGSTAAVTATGMSTPDGLFAIDNKLIVTDGANSRFLIFEAP